MTQKRRLLIVSGSFPNIRCGVSGHVRIIAERTAVRGDYEVAVLTSADEAVDLSAIAGAKAADYTVYPRVTKWSALSRRTICAEILQLEPDVVHVQNPTAKYSGWNSWTMSAVVPLLKRMAPSLRVVVMQHDIALSKPWLRRRYRPLLKATDAVTVSNSRDYQAVVDQGISREKIYLTPVGSHFQIKPAGEQEKIECRRRLGLPEGAKVVVFFGFVLPGRNVDVLIEALGHLRQLGRDVHGLILGGAHPDAPDYYEKLQQQSRQQGLDEHVSWTGFATEQQIADGLAGADVFVSLPQRGADLRNTSIQSGILAGLPVVTARNERYYVDRDLDQFGCVCVQPRQVNEVAGAIAALLDESPGAEVLAQRATLLEPERIWSKHIEMNCRAYRGEPPQ